MVERSESTIFSRHTNRADGSMGYGLESNQSPSEKYPSLTAEGEERAREIARSNFRDLVESSVDGSILFIGGASEEQRTKETAEIIGDELERVYPENGEVMVFTKEKIDELRARAKHDKGSIIDMIESFCRDNADKKIVFTFPLFLKEFSIRPHHREKETGKHTEYISEILKKTGLDENAAALEWFENKGKIETEDGQVLEVPSPQQTAETHIAGINRLREFANKFAQDRPVNIGMVGHGWQLDALALYLANEGKVDAESFEKIFGSQVIQQPEVGSVKIQEDSALFEYRGEEYKVPRDILE